MMQSLNHFSGQRAPQKINGPKQGIWPVFYFFSLSQGRFWAHMPSQCSLFRFITLGNSCLVNLITFCVGMEFKRFFSVSVFRADWKRFSGAFQTEFVNIKNRQLAHNFTFPATNAGFPDWRMYER